MKLHLFNFILSIFVDITTRQIVKDSGPEIYGNEGTERNWPKCDASLNTCCANYSSNQNITTTIVTKPIKYCLIPAMTLQDTVWVESTYNWRFGCNDYCDN